MLEAEGRLNGGLGAKPPGKWGPFGPHLGALFGVGAMGDSQVNLAVEFSGLLACLQKDSVGPNSLLFGQRGSRQGAQ